MSATDVLAGLEPAGVWEHFSELTRIARPPKEEAAAREHVSAWADRLGFESEADAEGNLVVRATASPGREAAPVVVLQSHLDMVCERDPDSSYDPRAGRILVEVEGDWVIAPETTLGADNGIGVAAAMAVAEDSEVARGPLELLFTVSEEQGLDGAKALDPALVSGRLLLNLDGTSDTSLTIGCAGSTHTFTRLPLPLEPVPDDHVVLEVAVSGARGGHSGGDIAKGRANAIKALGRVLGRETAPVGPARRRCEPQRAAAGGAGSRRGSRGGCLPRGCRAGARRDPRAVLGERRRARTLDRECGAGRRRGRGRERARSRPPRDHCERRRRDEPGPAGERRDEHEPERRDDRGRRPHARVDDEERQRAGARRRRLLDRGRRSARGRGRRDQAVRIRPGAPTSTPTCWTSPRRRSSGCSASSPGSTSSTAASSARFSATSCRAPR